MKRFLLGSLGSLFVSSLSVFGQTPPSPVMPKADSPVMLQHQPAAHCAPSVKIDTGASSCRRGDLVGGFDVLYLRAHHSNNPALSTNISDNVTITGGEGSDQSDNTTRIGGGSSEFSYDFNFSPRVWIGFQGDCVGFRGRWFHFDQAANDQLFGASDTGTLSGNTIATTSANVSSASPLGLGPINTVGSSSITVGGVTTLVPTGDVIAASSGLFLDQWDAEATLKLQSCGCNVLASAGVRYLFMEQTYNAFHPAKARTNLQDGLLVDRDFQEDTLISRQTFNGIGPTLGLEILRPIGDGNISLYCSGRGSILFGRGNQEATLSQFFLDEDFDGAGNVIEVDTNTVVNSARTGGYDVLSIGEIELGVQWGRDMGGMSLFVRPAFTGMVYWNGGNGSSREGDFGLVGGSLSIGVGY